MAPREPLCGPKGSQGLRLRNPGLDVCIFAHFKVNLKLCLCAVSQILIMIRHRKELRGGLGHFGDAVSATPIRRHRFGDGTFRRWDLPAMVVGNVLYE